MHGELRSSNGYTKETCSMAYQWNGNEHRWGERVRVNIPIQVSARLLAGIDGCMKNLSLSGALVKAGLALPHAAPVEGTAKLPAPSPASEAILAQVSRKLNAPVAVDCCEFAPTTVKDLLRRSPVRLRP